MARIAIQPDAFDVGAELVALVHGGETGAVGSFIGYVRGDAGLVAMTLEHYPGMTEAAITAIAAEAGRRWSLLGCTIIHRIGRLRVGEPIVLVLAASRHRAAALEATAFLIDWLKTDAPFWKREDWSDGTSRWVEGRAEDEAQRVRWLAPDRLSLDRRKGAITP